MPEIVVDDSRAPIVVVTFPRDSGLEEYMRAVDRYVEIARRGQRVGWLIDLRRFSPLAAPAPVRKAAAEYAARQVPVLQPVSAGEARVVTNPVMRGVSAAFSWLTAMHWPTRHFSTMEDAEAWLRAQLADSGPPPR